ncbi:hypothetical protein TNCV_1718361 [Trichonephila clavipes]|nr:hypothetical protein TNCV_1718361 [Trichonephila clavipes]
MSRLGGQSEARPPVFKSQSKLGTHLSTQYSRDERPSQPCSDLKKEYVNPILLSPVTGFWIPKKDHIPEVMQLTQSS